jgi:hypothetical protein
VLHQHADYVLMQEDQMRITVNIEDVTAYSASLWTGIVAPEKVRNLSSPLSSVGSPSVLLVEEPDFDEANRLLSFPLGNALVLNVGTTDEAVFIAARAEEQEEATQPTTTKVDTGTDVRLGFGDRECIRSFDRLPDDLREAGRQLIEHVRRLDPNGDLRYKPPRFVNSPDNWVTLQPQPQVREILVTFKGSVQTHLKQSKSARRPYQGFKLRSLEDVGEAKRVLASAQRRH